MISYRAGLTRIGIPATASVSYRGFVSRPGSLRRAVASMDWPTTSEWSQVSDIFRDDDWTDEVQGVAWDGARWLFSANANQQKPGHNDKAIYVFQGGQPLGDGQWISRVKYKDVPHPLSGTTESDDHWGQLCCWEGSVYVAHFWTGGAGDGTNVVVFKNTQGVLQFSRWIELEKPTSPTDGRTEKAEFQAINPWDGLFYTCFGSGDIHEFFLHDASGAWTGRALRLNPPVTRVQGACFSPNGHLYIATNAKLPSDARYQTIWYYSALNGHRLGVIPVMALEDEEELEGICYADVSLAGGQKAQIHAVLLENVTLALDNIFFKSFASSRPAVV
jgi:hypothetical protein